MVVIFIFTGAGFHVFNGANKGSQPNNGLAILTNPESGHRIRFFCRSDSLTLNVGELIGLDGNTFSGNDYLAFNTPASGGELRIQNTVGSEEPLPASEQGIYTCQIPLQSEEIVVINIGVYPIAFNCEFVVPVNGAKTGLILTFCSMPLQCILNLLVANVSILTN